MSATLILSLSLVIQSKPKAAPADAFGPKFKTGSKAYLYLEAAQTGKTLPVPVATSKETFQKSAYLFSVIVESKNKDEPLAEPPTARDAEKAQAELASLEKRQQILRADSKTLVQVLDSEVVVADTLRNREIQKDLGTAEDAAAREKSLTEISMRLCRVKFTEGKYKGKEAWVWSRSLVATLPKGSLAKSSQASTTRQKEIQLTLDKKKALAAKKKALKAAKTAGERAAAQKAYDQAMRDLPAQTAAQNQMIQQALQEEIFMRQQQAQAQMDVQIGAPIVPSGGGYP